MATALTVATVTVPQEYFNTLLRRAELHVEQEAHKPAARLGSSTISISKEEHGALLRASREYASLRAALLNGGVALETLNLLIKDLPRQPVSGQVPAKSHASWATVANSRPDPSLLRSKWSAAAPVFVPQGLHHPVRNVNFNVPRPESGSTNPDDYSCADGETLETFEDSFATGVDSDTNRIKPPDHALKQRTLIMRGIPPPATLLDIVKAIRGGQLLTLYIRQLQAERFARISFVDADRAEALFFYSKRAGIYVLGKRVELSYDDRQYFLPLHISHKISQFGATRNLVIRHVQPNMSAQSICDDLDHIHNLEVVEINIIRDEAYVSLNSIQFALTARACMHSRLKYKNCKIGFYPDECDQPLPQIPYKPARKVDAPAPKPSKVEMNRFQVLAGDGSEEEEEEEDASDIIGEPR